MYVLSIGNAPDITAATRAEFAEKVRDAILAAPPGQEKNDESVWFEGWFQP